MSAIELTRALEEAASLVAERHDAHLPRPQRLRIAALVARSTESGHRSIVALDALPVAQLGHLVAEKQLSELDRTLATARAALAGTSDRGQLEAARYAAEACADDAWMVGDDRSRALWFAAVGMLDGVVTSSPPHEDECDDEDLDPDVWDPAFEGSIAASDGTPGPGDGEPELRRRYWWWWLREAVPTAAGLLAPPPEARDPSRALHARELLAQRRWSARERDALRHVLAHRAPRDPAAWTDRQLKRQARDERQLVEH
jgi:hypothetical protein